MKSTTPFQVKAADFEKRTFEGWASVFSKDLVGDVIRKGAYKRTLDHILGSKARTCPLIDQHNYSSVFNVLGKLIDAEETDYGLWAKFQVVSGSKGDELLHRLKEGMITGLSIGYRAVHSAPGEQDGQRVRIISEVALEEVSCVIYPAHPDARIEVGSVKRQEGPGAAFKQAARYDNPALASRIRAIQTRALRMPSHRQAQLQSNLGRLLGRARR